MDLINESGDDLSDDDSLASPQPNDRQCDSEVESPNSWPEMSNADEDDFCMTPQNRPDQYGPADSGIEDCSGEDDEEWENINPRLRPGPVKRRHGVNVH